MADDGTETDGAPADPKDKKKAANRQRMMIAVGVVGLLLTYLLIKRSQSSSSGSASVDPNQALAQYEQQNESNLSGLASSIQALQAQVAAEVPVTAPGTGTNSPGNPTPAVGALSGSGFLPSGATGANNNPGNLESQSTSGAWYDWLTPAQYQATDPTSDYVETGPGVFTPFDPTHSYAKGTPIYAAVPGAS